MAETGLNGMGGRSALVTGAAKGLGRATAEPSFRVRLVRGVVVFLAVLAGAPNRRREGRAA